MKKQIKSPTARKKLDFLIISSLILALLAIFPAAASVSSLQCSYYPDTVQTTAQISNRAFEFMGLELVLASNENYRLINYIGKKIDFAYMLAGIGSGILVLFIYSHFSREENELIPYLRRTLYSFKNRIITYIKEAVQEKTASEVVIPENVVRKVEVYKEVTATQIKLYIAIPIMFIVIGEMLIFLGQINIAIWVHIGILFALTLSNIFTKNPKLHKIHMTLMLLPILRLINLSTPIFSKMTLYTFVLYYIPLTIPIAAIVLQQRNSLADIGITKKHLLPYIVLSVPLSFLLALGEYLTIRPGYLIPDLSFENLLMLTVIMVFFVGLVEELIFRSLLQTRLEQALSIPEALLITSFLFGLMHSGYGTYYEMLYASFVGFVIGLIYHKTRSLPFIAVLHGFVNVFLFGILPLRLIV